MPDSPPAPANPDREEQLFYRALDLPGAERERFLATECAQEPLLASRLRALLKAHGASAGFMERPAAERLPADPEVFAGAQVGRYALLREIGEGACGIVFHARQLAPIQRDVALKVLKRGMDTREVVARFEAERQALALLDHPNIARVLDAGATDNGRPFFVMDLVSGARITHFADESRLCLRERLALFAQVCDAIEHAHQKGVIHRDIKPSNVLVTLRNGVPVPVVIDFGVAKATAAVAGRTLATSAGTFLGTPGYLSPEQAESGAAAVDTRTDVYSLCALLHELLVGEPPFGRLSGPDLLRRLRDEDPRRPSAVVRSLSLVDRELLAAKQRTTSRQLIHSLQGDLDAIVQHGLERDRERRYASVRELAEDIRRHLALEPVRARAPGFAYVSGRWVRKHRAIAAVIAASIVLLTGTTLVSLRLAWAASRAERQAQAEAQTKQQMLTFLQDDLFAAAAQEAQPVWDLRWRGVLDRAAERIEGRFSNQPELASDMHATLARSYETLGAYPTAQEQFELARFHLQSTRQPPNARELGLAEELTRVLLVQAKYDYAFRIWSEFRERFADAEPLLRLRILRQLAEVDRERRNFTAAEQTAREAIALAQRSQVPPIELARSWQTLAEIQRNLSPADTAVDSARRALALAREAAPHDEAATLPLMGTLALCLRFSGHRDEAEVLYRDLIERRSRLLGPEHPDTLTTFSQLSLLLQDVGRYDEAVQLAQREIEVKRRVIGPEHPITLGAETNLAFLFQLARRWDEAVALHRGVLAVRERVLGANHFANASSLFGIGVALRASGRAEEGEPWLRRAAELRRLQFGSDHRETLLAESEWAAALSDLARPAEAEPLLRHVVEVQRAQDPDGWTTAVSASRWGASLVAVGRLDEAEPALLAAEQRFSRTAPHLLPATRTQLAETLRHLQRLYLARERPELAARWKSRAQELGLD